MNTPKEMATKGMNFVAGAGMGAGLVGVASTGILDALNGPIGLNISENFINTIGFPTGVAGVIGLIAWGLKGMLMNGTSSSEPI